MKVKCTLTDASELNEEALGRFNITGTEQYYLTRGKEYTVYAVGEINGNVWYCILDGGSHIPLWNPSILFQIIDCRLSRYWIFSIEDNNGLKKPFLSYLEWARDPYYYTELFEGASNNPETVIFQKYKDLMELEFPDKNVKEIAQVGNESWLICPCCMDAWECNNTLDGMVKCPKCNRIIHNPRYAKL